ncbi:MAG: RHS repeat-associated core domain-containing protein, partial [Sandaracinaceae bacterium]
TGASTIHYDGFGNVRSSSGPLAALPAHGGPRFQGMWLDPEGLYYVRARTYDAETGRFTSRDPADIRRLVPEYWAPYGFAYQNAYVFRDPSGATSLVEQMATVAIVFIQAAVRTARLLASAASVACAINAVLLTVGDLPSFGPCGNQRFYQTLSLEDAARAKVLSDQLNQFLIPALVAGTLKMVPANTVYSEWPVITRLALCTKRPLRTSSWGSDAFEASHSMP